MERFPDGARVCFIGDSITEQNRHVARIVHHYNKYFPNAGISIYNCGVSGSSAQFQCEYFERNVLPFNPTHAVLMIGVNDSRRDLLLREPSSERYNTLVAAYENFKKYYTELCDKLLSRGIKLTLCTQAPFDEYQKCNTETLPGGYALILGYADFVRALAKEKNLPLCDYHGYLTRAMQSDTLYDIDRVHPNDLGQYLMAKCFLAHQGLEIDEFAPHPAYMDKWRELVSKRLSIYAVELMLVDRKLSDEEKVVKMKEYLDKKAYVGSGHDEYFKLIAEKYLETKPKEQEILENILIETENLKACITF